MRKFNITVNGKTYEVEVEEIKDDENKESVVHVPRPSVNPVEASQKAAPSSAQKPQASKSGTNAITAPMPGTILDVRVKEGQHVKRGDVVLILEAMKMENEIMAPNDGTIASINVEKGTSVNTGDVLVTMN